MNQQILTQDLLLLDLTSLFPKIYMRILYSKTLAYMFAIFRHSVAHFRHSSAHCWQWLSLNIAHSLAQASQILAQTPQICWAKSLLADINRAAIEQISEQARSSDRHLALALTSSSFRQDSKHSSQTCIQR